VVSLTMVRMLGCDIVGYGMSRSMLVGISVPWMLDVLIDDCRHLLSFCISLYTSPRVIPASIHVSELRPYCGRATTMSKNDASVLRRTCRSMTVPIPRSTLRLCESTMQRLSPRAGVGATKSWSLYNRINDVESPVLRLIKGHSGKATQARARS
jgi:hypothetical protein